MELACCDEVGDLACTTETDRDERSVTVAATASSTLTMASSSHPSSSSPVVAADRSFQEYLDDVAGDEELEVSALNDSRSRDQYRDHHLKETKREETYVNDSGGAPHSSTRAPTTPGKRPLQPQTVSTTRSTPVTDILNQEGDQPYAYEYDDDNEEDDILVEDTEEGSLYSASKNQSRGPLSPFSPLLKTAATSSSRRTNSSLQWTQTDARDLSMVACRRVSVVVNVVQPARTDTGDTKKDKSTNRLCLFPLDLNALDEKEQINKKPNMSPTSATLQSATETRDLVIVNPTAFGKLIPSDVTMETARLVAAVAHIQTEDWARIYKFHQVLWPGGSTAATEHLCDAIVNDVAAVGSIAVRTVLGMGHDASKTASLFGNVGTQSIAQVFAQSTLDLTAEAVTQRYGMLGLTASKILERNQESAAIMTVSILEVVEEDVLFDLQATRPFSQQAKLKLRHSGEKHGAKVAGLSDVPVDSLKGLGHCLRRAFAAALHKNRKQVRGHIVATLRVWQPNNSGRSNRRKYTAVQFVDLAALNTDNAVANTRRNASIRKSTSALGGILRSTLLKEAGNETMISYRESTLTKVLQRSLDHPDSRVLVLANVSPLSDSYHESMTTLRYVSRLLYRPGQPPQSPFDTPSKATSPTSLGTTPTNQSPLSLDQFSGGEELLANMLSDPRQRLAKVMRPLHRNKVALDAMESSVEAYIPTRYMEVDPATIGQSPRSEEKEEERPSSLPEREERAYQIPEQYSSTLPTPVTRNGEGRELFEKGHSNRDSATTTGGRLSKAALQAREIDTSFNLDSMERGEDDADSYADPSPLTADTGEMYSSSTALDDMARQVLEKNRQVLEQSSTGFPCDSGSDQGNDEVAAEVPTSKLMGWHQDGDDTYDLGEQDSKGVGMDELSAELLHQTQSGVPPEDELSSNTQEMDDLSAELFQKKQQTNEHLSSELFQKKQHTNEHEPPEEELRRVAPESVYLDSIDRDRDAFGQGDFRRRPSPQQYPSQSTMNSSLASHYLPPMDGVPNDMIERPKYRRPGSMSEAKVGQGVPDANRYLPKADKARADTSKKEKSLARALGQQSQHNKHELQQLVEEAKAAQHELGLQSRQYQDTLEQRERELSMLQEKLRKSESDRGEVLKIAEEAIATQAQLEERVTQLEEELSVQADDQGLPNEILNLEQSNASLSQDIHEMRNEIYQYKTELNERSMTISELQFALKSFEKERAQLLELRTQDQEEMQQLRDFVDDAQGQRKETINLRNEISRLQRANDSLQTATRIRESELLQELVDKDEYIESRTQEASDLRAELAAVHDLEKTHSGSRQREISSLQVRISELQHELLSNQERHEDYEQQLEEGKQSKKSFERQLESTNENLKRRISDVQELSSNLKSVLDEKAEDEARIADMERALESFQSETRTRVERVLQHRNEAASLLETTLRENQVLAETNQDLQDSLEDLRQERDESRRWTGSRAREEPFAATTPTREAHSPHRTTDYQRPRDTPIKNVDRWRPSDSIRASPYSVHGRGTLGYWDLSGSESLGARAEEVAAYVAASAKESIERSSHEASQLRQELYAVEDSKEAEIEALKARIRGLERRVDPRGYSY